MDSVSLDQTLCFSPLLVLLVLMTVTDKPVIAVKCWRCEPCMAPSSWQICVADMCYNISDKHGRGTIY